MNQLDFVADELLSTNHEQVLAKKRENFKKVVLLAIQDFKPFIPLEEESSINMAEYIVKKTFDEGIVN